MSCSVTDFAATARKVSPSPNMPGVAPRCPEQRQEAKVYGVEEYFVGRYEVSSIKMRG